MLLGRFFMFSSQLFFLSGQFFFLSAQHFERSLPCTFWHTIFRNKVPNYPILSSTFAHISIDKTFNVSFKISPTCHFNFKAAR